MKFVASRKSSLVKTKPFLFGAFSGILVFGLDDPTKATKLFLPSLEGDSRIERGLPTKQTIKPVSASTAKLLRGGHGFSFSTSSIKDAVAVPSEVAQAYPVSDVSPWQGSATSFLGKKTSSNERGSPPMVQESSPEKRLEWLATGLRQFVANLGTIVEGGIVTEDGKALPKETEKPPVPALTGLESVTDAQRLKGPEKIATAEEYEDGRKSAQNTDSVYIKVQGGDYTYTEKRKANGVTHSETAPEDLFWRFEVVPKGNEAKLTNSDTDTEKITNANSEKTEHCDRTMDMSSWVKFQVSLDNLVDDQQMENNEKRKYLEHLETLLERYKTKQSQESPGAVSDSQPGVVLCNEKDEPLTQQNIKGKEQWMNNKFDDVLYGTKAREAVIDRLGRGPFKRVSNNNASGAAKQNKVEEESLGQNEEDFLPLRKSEDPMNDFLKFVIKESPSSDHIEKRILPGAWVSVMGLSDEEEKAIASTGSVVITVTVYSRKESSITVTVCQPPSVMVFARLNVDLNKYLDPKEEENVGVRLPAKDFEVRPQQTTILQPGGSKTEMKLQLSAHGSRIPIDWTVERVTKHFDKHYGHIHTANEITAQQWGGFGGSYLMKTKTIIDEQKWPMPKNANDDTIKMSVVAREAMLKNADSKRPNDQQLNIPSYEEIVSIGYSTDESFTKTLSDNQVQVENNQMITLKSMIPFTSEAGFEVQGPGTLKYNLRHLCLVLYPAGKNLITVKNMATDMGHTQSQSADLVNVLTQEAFNKIRLKNIDVQAKNDAALHPLADAENQLDTQGTNASPLINELKSVLQRRNRMAENAHFVDLNKKN